MPYHKGIHTRFRFLNLKKVFFLHFYKDFQQPQAKIYFIQCEKCFPPVKTSLENELYLSLFCGWVFWWEAIKMKIEEFSTDISKLIL